MTRTLRALFLPVLSILVVFASFFCGKKLTVEELIVGRWALTGNDCDSEGRCREIYKFMSKDFYERNGKSAVMEFRSGGTMTQPILGEGSYRFEGGRLSIGINAGGETAWNESHVEFVTRDDMVMRFKKNWRRFRRIR